MNYVMNDGMRKDRIRRLKIEIADLDKRRKANKNDAERRMSVMHLIERKRDELAELQRKR